MEGSRKFDEKQLFSDRYVRIPDVQNEDLKVWNIFEKEKLPCRAHQISISAKT